MNELFKVYSQDTHLLKVSDIVINREARQRRAFVVDDLLISLKKRGQSTPILVRRDTLELVAGERRITAFKELGWESILARYVEEVNPIELQIIELEENMRRLDLSWQDQVKAIATIHTLYCTLDPEWTAAETAASLGLSQAAISKNIRLWNEMQDASGINRIAGAAGSEQAYNIISRKDQRSAARALEDLIGATPQDPAGQPSKEELAREPESPKQPTGPNPSILDPIRAAPALPKAQLDPTDSTKTLNDFYHGSFLDWAPLYKGPKFNLIHCDFPYGVNLFKGEYGKRGSDIQYDDSRDVFFDLLDCFCDNLDNFCSLSAHIVFWFSFEHYDAIKSMFRNKAPSIEWVRDPLIWGKSDNAGIIRDARRHPRHVYECALMGIRGSRHVVKSVGDFYSAPTERGLHPSAKSEPMLRNFFQMLVDENTEILDPTCGAGSALRAAHSLGARRVFGIEADPQHVSIAQTTLNNTRRLKRAAKIVETKS